MATIQEPIVDTIIEPKLELIDKIRGETLQEIATFLKNRDIKFGYLLDFLVNPQTYPGNKITGLRQISEKFLQDIVSKYYFEIQTEGLPVKFVINTVRKNLFQKGMKFNKTSHITVATRGGDDARKAVSTSRIDEPPRLLVTKIKDRKVRSKSKSNLPIKKKKEQVKTVLNRTYRRGRKGSCAYCGANAKPRTSGNTVHINITQNPSYHHFCSKDCKSAWIYALLNKKINLRRNNHEV